VRRNRLAVSAAATFALVLIGALAWVSSIYTIADRERTKSEAINEFMGDALYAASPDSDGPETRVVDVLGRVCDLSAEKFREQPDLRASLLDTVGRIDSKLGEFKLAQQHLEESIAMRRTLGQEDSLEVLSALSLLAQNITSSDEGDPVEAVELAQATYDGMLRTIGPEHDETLQAQATLGHTLSEANLDEEAAKHLTASHREGQRLFGSDNPIMATLGMRLALFKFKSGELDEALQLAETSYANSRARLGQIHLDTLEAANERSMILIAMGRAPEALEVMQEVVDITRQTLGPGRYQTQRFAAILGDVQISSKNLEGAVATFQQAISEC
jgi:tetratricopeptide (TPR) repeat protein